MIFAGLRHGMSPGLKGVGDGDVVLMDTVPLIRHILCPHIRSVSEHLMSRSEKSDLEHTVAVMADLGLNLTQIQLSEGKFKYQLEPDLDHISTFPDVAHQSLNYWTCQLVSREVQEEYIRRATPKVSKVSAPEKQQQQQTRTGKDKEIAMETEVVTVTLDGSNADPEAVTTAPPNVTFHKPQQPSNVLRANKEFSNVKEVVSSSYFFITLGFAFEYNLST